MRVVTRLAEPLTADAFAPFGWIPVADTDPTDGVHTLTGRIFDAFVQLDRSLNQPREGVGLGLTISRDLARAMGGDLHVDSTVGEGSTFTLDLPLAARPRIIPPPGTGLMERETVATH